MIDAVARRDRPPTSLARLVSLAAVMAVMAAPVAAVAGATQSCDALATAPPALDTIIVEGPSHPLFGPYGIELKDINDQGVAVGWWNALSKQPCMWTEAGGFQAIPTPSNVSSAIPREINNNGWIIANGETAQGPRGFVLVPQEEGYQWIEIAPTSPVRSQVAGINDKNQVVGHQSLGSPGDPAHPHSGFFWSLETGKIDIVFDGWLSCECEAINDAGVICGNVSQTAQAFFTASTKGFVLVDGTLGIVEPSPPYTISMAKAVNDSGIVGGTFQVYGASWQAQAYLLDVQDGRLHLLERPDGYAQWGLVDLNDQGLALGTARIVPGQGPMEPALAWASGGALLKDLVSPEIASTLKLGANAIANDGTALTKTSLLWKFMVHTPKFADADLNCDGAVGSADLAVLLSSWGSSQSAGDVDGDGAVDGDDLGLLLSAWSMP